MNQNSVVKIAIDDLLLDNENPRFPADFKPNNESEIINWMIGSEALSDLMASIAENGFFEGEPIVVMPSKTGKYITIEGNRRLAAVKLLQNPNQENISPITVQNIANIANNNKTIPSHLPAFIVINRQQVAKYLAFRHVSGVKSWPLISKARFLYSLLDANERETTNYEVFKTIARQIGSKATYVRRTILGYRAFLKIVSNSTKYAIKHIDESLFKLSLITDAITMYPDIANYINFNSDDDNAFATIAEEKFTNLVKWLYSEEKIITDSRQLRELNQVLRWPEATAMLEKGATLLEAKAFTGEKELQYNSQLEIIISNLKSAEELASNLPLVTDDDLRKADRIIDLTYNLQKTLKKRKHEFA